MIRKVAVSIFVLIFAPIAFIWSLIEEMRHAIVMAHLNSFACVPVQMRKVWGREARG